MSRFGIATVFEDVSDGYEFTESNTPLHLTHVDVCEVNLEPTEFVGKLRNYSANIPAFEVVPTEDAFFGSEKDIPVTLIAMSPALRAFHTRLMTFLTLNGAVLDNPQFHNEHYDPHISIYGKWRVALGQPLFIKSVYRK